jgi:hypothetical protein
MLIWFISIYYAVISLTHYKNPIYFKGLGWLLFVFFIYGLVLLISGEELVIFEVGSRVQNFSYIKGLFNSLLPIYPFYVFGRKGYFTNKRLIIYPVAFVILSISSFFAYQSSALIDSTSSERFEVTNNMGYSFVAIIPLLVLLKRNLLKYILFAVCVAFILLSIKRGAIVTGLFATVVFMFSSLKNSKRGVKFVAFLSVIVIGLGIYFLASDLMQNNAYFQSRLDRSYGMDDSSVRSIIYSGLLEHFWDSKILNQLFGNGAFATTKFAINFAHNDWLEILIDHGVFGILLYITYWICFYKTWRLSRNKNDASISVSILLVMLIYFVKSFFSMSYYSMEMYATFTLGYCLSQLSVTSNEQLDY